MRKKKVKWELGELFAIPLIDGRYVVGHVLDQRMINTVRIAIYNEILTEVDNVDVHKLINIDNLISLIEITREQLDFGVWRIIGKKANTIPVDEFPNEEYRKNKWINSLVHDAALAEDFVNAYYALASWDDFYDPNYLDKYLVSSSKKPNYLLYKKKGE